MVKAKDLRGLAKGITKGLSSEEYVRKIRMNEDITFNTLSPTGRVIDTKVIHRSDLEKCPSLILLAQHYRADGSCRHDEVICEEEGCTNIKYQNEIFCMVHLEEMGAI